MSSFFHLNHSCKTIYGIYLQSYFIIVLNVIFFGAFKLVAEHAIFPAVSGSFRFMLGYEKYQSALTPEEQKKSFYKNKIYFLILQGCLAVVPVVVSGMSLDYSKSVWNQYQIFYGNIVNSSVLTVVTSCLVISQLNLTDEEKKMQVIDDLQTASYVGLFIFGSLLLPVVVTHILPGFFFYIWVYCAFFVGLIIVLAPPALLFQHCAKQWKLSPIIHDKINFEIASMLFLLIALFVCQTLFNYMYLIYQVHTDGETLTATQYVGVIVTEYELRTQTFCLYQNALSSAKNAMVLFNWL